MRLTFCIQMISATLISALLAFQPTPAFKTPTALMSFAASQSTDQMGEQTKSLPLAQVLEKFRPIPVFVICDAKGNPIFARKNTEKVIALFFNIEEANGLLPGIQKESGIAGAKVFVASFADFFGKAGYRYELFGSEFEKDFALSIIKKTKPDEKTFSGVPVFFLIEPNGNYLTIFENNSNQVPIFFSSLSAEMLRKEAGKISNSLNKLTIKATSFESIVELLLTKSRSQTSSFKFMAHPESMRNAADILKRKN